MAGGTNSAVARQIHRLFGQGTVSGLSEVELLERFVAQRDEAAFEALVARHGPIVLAVCRHLLCDPRDVEDAFQATFLVLVRKAHSIRQRELLGNWLYGVAHRVAVRARANAARRKSLERIVEDARLEPMTDVERHELQPLLHEEINRLPAKYRIPIVLCYLEGQTHAETAAQLGCPVGTVHGRLARAREMLKKRLTRRGVGLSAGAAAALLTEKVTRAAVPQTLIDATIKYAVIVVAGRGAAAGAVSATVASLTEGVLKTMLLCKLRVAAVAIVAFGITLTSAVVLAFQATGGDKPSALSGDAPRKSEASPPTGAAAAQELRPSQPPRTEENRKIIRDLSEERVRAEILEMEVELERQALQTAMQMEEQLSNMQDSGPGGMPPDEYDRLVKQPALKRLERATQRVAVLKRRYLEDAVKLSEQKMRVAELEQRSGAGTHESPNLDRLERRLLEVERKLDKVLKVMEESKRTAK